MATVIGSYNQFRTWLRDAPGVAIRAPSDCARNTSLLDAYKVIFYKTSGTITLPADFNTANNTVECIGEGGRGNGGTTLNSGGGGGGGAYAKRNNYSVKGPYESLTVIVGTGGSGSQTQFDSGASGGCQADFGVSPIGTTGGAGGLVANCIGDVKFAGGNGSDGGGTIVAGGSAGGAAGPSGAGGNAAASITTTSGNGGTADNGKQAGGAGVGTANNGNPGIAESPFVWTQTSNGEGASPSSGASGGGGLNTSEHDGGNAVAYGGGSGGGNLVASAGSLGGNPAPGIIVLTYVATDPPPFGGMSL